MTVGTKLIKSTLCWPVCSDIISTKPENVLLERGTYLISSWMLWGGVGREAGTSTVLGAWFKARSSSFGFRPDVLFTKIERHVSNSSRVKMVAN